MRIDDVLKTRSATLLRDFEDRHTLHDVIEITSTKASHVLVGTYEAKDGTWMARVQPAHLFDGRFRAGTFSLSYDQLNKLIEALMEVRETLSDKPASRVRIVKPASKQAAAVTQAQAPAPAEDQVLVAIDRLARGLETVIGRLEALEAAVPQKDEEAEIQAEWARDIAWQVKHTQAPYDCPICGKEYKSRGRYLTHVAEKHGISVEL